MAHRPVTEEDLPRPIGPVGGAAAGAPAGDIAAAVKASFGADFKGLAKGPTVHVEAAPVEAAH